jgi:hypothetical protein
MEEEDESVVFLLLVVDVFVIYFLRRRALLLLYVVVGQSIVTVVTSSMIDLGTIIVVVPCAVLVPLSWQEIRLCRICCWQFRLYGYITSCVVLAISNIVR